MRFLGQPHASFAGDTGEPDADVRAALASAYTDARAYQRAIVALCTSRFLLPIVATGDDGGDGPDPERHAEMAAVLVQSDAGATAVPVFTGLDALTAWHPQARPVPCTLDDVAATAAETGSTAVVIDIAGPASMVLEGDVLTHLGQGHRLVELDDGGFGWVYAAPGG
ncbi:MAG: SseB family protein [Propionibacteriaceae bacterium]|nr:SseB family protein [Propionibacteriaceae bacterium]